MNRRSLKVLLLITAGAPAALASTVGLTIHPIFDSTISNDAHAAAIEGAIDAAIQDIEGLYRTTIPTPVSIYFQEGGGLGQSNDLIYGVTYTAFYSALVATDANPQAIAALNANGGDAFTNGGLNPQGNVNAIEIKGPDARAIGLNIPPGCYVQATGKGTSNGNVPNQCALSGSSTPVDGIISLNTTLTDPPHSPASSNYDLIGVTEHEINEILGLGSALENCNSSNPSGNCPGSTTLNLANDTPFGFGAPEDLFRWSAPTGGVRTSSTNCGTPTTAYFAYGPNTGALGQFNNSCNNGDFGDWKSSPLPSGTTADIQDAFTGQGATAAYGVKDIDAMSAIGYTLATPEPATWLTISAASALLAFRRRAA